MIGQAYGIEAVALRFFNTYGTRQALSNPYTGVLAIFASRLLNNNPPLIYEDGNQLRDFVNIRDVVEACALAMEAPGAAGNVLNIASGRQHRVCSVASMLGAITGANIEPSITGKYRVGDVRHCFADISQARQVLGYQPKVALEQGLAELAEWLHRQIADDKAAAANEELAKRGLAI